MSGDFVDASQSDSCLLCAMHAHDHIVSFTEDIFGANLTSGSQKRELIGPNRVRRFSERCACGAAPQIIMAPES